MRELAGIPAAPGFGVGVPVVYDARPAHGPARRGIAAAASEAAGELESLAAELAAAGREDEAAILRAQATAAVDPALLAEAHRRTAAGEDAVTAMLAAGERAAVVLESADDEAFAARASDVRDVVARVVRALERGTALELTRPSILVAEDLPPSLLAELDRSLLAGVALERGSPAAHVAIMARGLRIPAVVGVANLREAVADAPRAEVSVDGDTGTVVVGPSSAGRVPAEIAGSREPAAGGSAAHRELGHRVVLAANIGRVEDASAAMSAGAQAVGLLRTEFLFSDSERLPDEASQRRAYEPIFAILRGIPVSVRLADLASDGDRSGPGTAAVLGIRGIRVARRDPDRMSEQIRAILRAAASVPDDDLRLLAPMVGDMADLALFRSLVEGATEELQTAGLARPRRLLGAMVEVPSAVMLADQIVEDVDFVSIGTNDLTQYLLAADRSDPELADWQDPMHPAVVRAIHSVIAAARTRGIPVSVCGEMAADPASAVVLAGLGVDELSMRPGALAVVRRALGVVTPDQAAAAARAVRDVRSAAAARETVARLVPRLREIS